MVDDVPARIAQAAPEASAALERVLAALLLYSTVLHSVQHVISGYDMLTMPSRRPEACDAS
jgi:hypothetical protein